MNTAVTYPFYDPEGNGVTVTASEIDLTGSPSFISFTSNSLTIKATQFSELGAHNLLIKLSDGQPLITQQYITVTFTNSAPYFSSAPQLLHTVHLNEVKFYDLPSIIDQESNPYTVTVNPSTAFVSLIGPKLIFAPTLFSDVQSHTLSLSVCDGEPLSTTYLMNIIVANDPPTFSSPLVD